MSNHSDNFIKEFDAFISNNIILPRIITDNYIFISCLCETQKKTLYLLQSKHLGKFHILKCSSAQSDHALADEYHLLKSINHHGIAKAEFYFEQDDIQYLILDYFEGVTLAQYIEENGVFNDRDTIRIMMQMCDIVGYLHALNPPVIHRDIKPQNIIFANDGSCKLIDFDIARRFRSDSQADTEYLGTRCVAAPEQFGYMQTSTRTDIYAMGILLLYLQTGSFETDKVCVVKNKALARIINKCIRFDPKARFSSVSQLKRSLKKLNFVPKNVPRIAIAITAAMAACTFFVISTLQPSQHQNTQGLALKKQAIQQTVGPEQPDEPRQTVEPTQIEPSPSLSPAAITETAGSGDPVTFSSPLVENAVRIKLGLSETDIITTNQLDEITRLYICGDEVYNNWDNVSIFSPFIFLYNDKQMERGDYSTLEDIAKLKNLTELALFNENISDISALKDLKLKKLALGGNNISDVSALSGCNELEVLVLNNNPISDITPLASLSSLKELNIDDTDVNDFSPVTACPLDTLSISNCPIQSYYPLLKLTGLTNLTASHLNINDISLCSQMSQLERLSIINSDMTDLSCLAALNNLTFLCAVNCHLSDISGIKQFTQLAGADLANNPIKDISPLSGLEMSYVSIAGTKVHDFTPLAQMPGLTNLGCSADQEADVKQVLDGRPVDIVIVF